jgi:hypothetical protein
VKKPVVLTDHELTSMSDDSADRSMNRNDEGDRSLLMVADVGGWLGCLVSRNRRRVQSSYEEDTFRPHKKGNWRSNRRKAFSMRMLQTLLSAIIYERRRTAVGIRMSQGEAKGTVNDYA